MNFFSPFELSIVLHYYCRCDEHESRHAPIFDSCVDRLVKLDLLARAANEFPSIKATERGKAFVELGLMRTLIPVQVWTMPANGNHASDATASGSVPSEAQK